jgi:hypothetical protein
MKNIPKPNTVGSGHFFVTVFAEEHPAINLT